MASDTAPFPNNLPCFPYQQTAFVYGSRSADDAPFVAVRMMWLSLLSLIAFPLGFVVTGCLWFTAAALPVLVLFFIVTLLWQLPPVLALMLFIVYEVTKIIYTARYPN